MACECLRFAFLGCEVGRFEGGLEKPGRTNNPNKGSGKVPGNAVLRMCLQLCKSSKWLKSPDYIFPGSQKDPHNYEASLRSIVTRRRSVTARKGGELTVVRTCDRTCVGANMCFTVE